MKTLYLECDSGASGDMLCAALADLFTDKRELERDIASIGLPRTQVTFNDTVTSGIRALRCRVVCDGREEEPSFDGNGRDSDTHPDSRRSSHGMSLCDIENIISSLNINDKVKTDAVNVYKLIADAESRVHGIDVGEIHFHELGMLDAVADVVVCSYLFDRLGAEWISVSDINVGSGTVESAHGVIPVPAPATAYILGATPYYKCDVKAELCTPTGAALLKYFGNEFTEFPHMNTVAVGVGAGSRELFRPNVLRAFLSEENVYDAVCELQCNIDDMTGEELSYACEKILACGAPDVFLTPVYMKKGRGAYMLTVLCALQDKEKFERLIFQNTSTIGIREHRCARSLMDRREETVSAPFGEVDVKISSGYGAVKFKAEYESVKKIADEHNISFTDAENLIYGYLQNNHQNK